MRFAVFILAAGCTSGPTTFDDVAPILARSCTQCHRSGGAAPFSLETYDDVQPNASRIADAITSREMPPWDAVRDADCNPRVGFAHDESLSDAEIQRITEWIARGAPPGSPQTRAVSRVVGEIADPDLTIAMVAPYQPLSGDDFRCFTLDPGLDQDAYITGIDFVPGNRRSCITRPWSSTTPERPPHTSATRTGPIAARSPPVLPTCWRGRRA